MAIYTRKVYTDYPHIRAIYENWAKSEKHEIRISIETINKRYRKYRQVNKLDKSSLAERGKLFCWNYKY